MCIFLSLHYPLLPSITPSHFLPVPQLAEPSEGLGILHLLNNHLLYHVTSMDVNGTDGHDTLPAGLGHVTQ